MRKQSWTKRDPIKNYFPLPNEIYDLGLSRGAISVYSFLLRREDRKTYQCLLSYREIGEGVGMCVTTVRKYVAELEERSLIRTPHRAHDRYHQRWSQAQRPSALSYPAYPVGHRSVL